jgi:hypothetical protein
MSARPSTPLRAAAGCALAALVLACGSAPDERPERRAEPQASARADGAGPRVAGDPRLERLLATAIRTQSVVDGVKHVAFELRSLASEKLAIAWSIEWFDRDGRPLASLPSAWQRITLPAGGAIPLEVRAPVPEADSWRLRAVDSRTLE